MASHPTVLGERRVGPVYANDDWFARLVAPHGSSVRIFAVDHAVMRIRRLMAEADTVGMTDSKYRRRIIDGTMGRSAYHFDNPGIGQYLADATWLGALLRTGHSLRLAPCDEYGNETVDSEPSK